MVSHIRAYRLKAQGFLLRCIEDPFRFCLFTIYTAMNKAIALAFFVCALASQPDPQSDEACDDTDDTCALQTAKSSEVATEEEVLSITCTNLDGNKFLCGKGSSCCGNSCTTGPCCKNYDNYKFGCGAGSKCCGNACAAPGSKCCNTGVFGQKTGYQYPVSKDTKCVKTQLSKECRNHKTKAKFWCAPDDQCCGGACVAQDGVCCINENNDGFPCAKDNMCCGNVCASADSKCCRNTLDPNAPWFPLTKATATASSMQCFQ